MGRTSDIEEQLRKAITAAGPAVSRYAIAKESGVSETVLSHFVHRKRTITLKTAAKLAAVLGLELKPTGAVGRKSKKGA